MFYNNLIYFLIIIFVLSTDSAPDSPSVAPQFAVPGVLFFLYLYSRICRRVFPRGGTGSANRYFASEKKLSVLAVLFFVFVLYFFDLKYYLQPLTLGGRLPVLANIGGIAVFVVFLVLMWSSARRYYEAVFHRSYTLVGFITANIKINLPILLPWLVLSLVFDILSLLQLPGFARIMQTYWGDLVLFFVFVLFLVLFFPPLVRWLWNCTPMPAGSLRTEIEAFFKKQGFSSDILLWPLFEGQVITAGVMGIIPRFRYVLVTPALLNTMNRDELEAVLAHEIGHVKKKHLLLYILLFLGFSLFFSAAVEPIPYLVLVSDWFYSLPAVLHVGPEVLLAILVAMPALLFMLVYFRFIFGYFIRNFERQADLHVFSALGESASLVSSFEKIARLSGNIRDRKSWHHFGIGERIAFLDRCEQDRAWIRKHDRKVNASLALYLVIIALSVTLMYRVDFEQLAAGYEPRFVEAVIRHKLHQEPDNGLWFLLLGNLMQEKKMERKALDAYEKALHLEPVNGDTYNNLAWLLVTAQDASLHDPARALSLALKAVELKPAGYVFDTLAVAYWANGMVEEAVSAENKALEVDPENRKYYLQQRFRFREQRWGSGLP
jgi:Zn-dependent protease with chaperone function